MDLSSEMHMLLFEVLKNSIEEAKEGFCTEIAVSFLEGNSVRISDDGRGLPIEKGEDIFSKIFEGKLISKKEYLLTDNLVLDEIKTVNALSESMQVTVYRKGKCYRQDYIKGIAQHPLIETADAHKTGMVIEFTPDSDIFTNCRWDKEKISGILAYILDNDEQIKQLNILNKKAGIYNDIENKENLIKIIEDYKKDNNAEELKDNKLAKLTEELITDLLKDNSQDDKNEKMDKLNKAANTIILMNKKDQVKILDTLNYSKDLT
jgi:DNA gyrase/topoisomerase IV subunit B